MWKLAEQEAFQVCVYLCSNLHAIVHATGTSLLCHCRLVHIVLSHVGDTAGT